MAIFQSLEFDGINSLDNGVFITGEAVYNAPEREVEMISIPGRNGDFALDKGRFENISVTYPAGAFGTDQAEFAKKIRSFRNLLVSKKGYKRLVDTYNPDEYRMAIFKDAFEVDAVNNSNAGEFEIVFDCKPQRYLMSGEAKLSVNSGDTIYNPTPFDSSPMLEIEGYGTIGFNGYEIELEDAVMGDTIIIDSGKVSGTKSSASSSNYYAYLNFHPDAYNVGDEITYGDVTLIATVRLTPLSGYHVTSIEEITEGLTVTAYRNHDGTFDATYQYTLPSGSFTSGQSGATIATQALEIKMNYGNGTSSTCSNTFNIYTGWRSSINRQNFQLGFLQDTLAMPTEVMFRHGTIRANSTVSLLGNPTYIDCDLGEAYVIKNDVPVSLNSYIDLGSDLPKLASGNNEITYDNTVTDLKIIPRWWIV